MNGRHRTKRTHVELLLRVLRERRSGLLRLTLWSTVEAVPAFVSGRLVATAIDHGFLAHRTEVGLGWLGLMALSVLVGGVGTRQTYLQLAAIVEPFRDELVDLVVSSDLRRSAATGEATDKTGLARLTHQVEIVRESFATVLMVAQTFVVTTVSALLGLLTVTPYALLLVLPPLLLGLVIFVGSLRAMAPLQRKSILADEEIAERVSTVASGLRDVVAAGGEDRVRQSAGEAVDRQAAATAGLARVTAVRSLSLGVSAWIPLLLVLIGARWLVREGASTGDVLGALTYVLMGVHPAVQTLIRGVGGSGLWLFVTLRRIAEMSDLAAPPVAPPNPRRASAPIPFDPAVELSNVTFRYGGRADPILLDLSLRLPADGHLAVVGPSGVGKSTLARVIAGLAEPQAGAVRIGGVPLRDWPPADLARYRVLIPQEAYVFAGTVEENLRYLCGDATQNRLDEAVDAVGALPLLRRLGGYRAQIDPRELSAGERQLITLARAYLSPARLVILDEATCYLDPEREARAEAAFARRPGAMLVIAHRMSSALRAQQILVLDGTHAVAGTHRELLARSPLYRDLTGHWQAVEPVAVL